MSDTDARTHPTPWPIAEPLHSGQPAIFYSSVMDMEEINSGVDVRTGVSEDDLRAVIYMSVPPPSGLCFVQQQH